MSMKPSFAPAASSVCEQRLEPGPRGEAGAEAVELGTCRGEGALRGCWIMRCGGSGCTESLTSIHIGEYNSRSCPGAKEPCGGVRKHGNGMAASVSRMRSVVPLYNHMPVWCELAPPLPRRAPRTRPTLDLVRTQRYSRRSQCSSASPLSDPPRKRTSVAPPPAACPRQQLPAWRDKGKKLPNLTNAESILIESILN